MRKLLKILSLVFFAGMVNMSTNAFAQENYRFLFDGFLGEKSDKFDGFLNPESITVDFRGDIYIADTGKNRIVKMRPDGQIMKTVGGFGRNTNQFDEPVSVSAGSNLNLLVTDKNNNRIVRYDLNLNFTMDIALDRISNQKYNIIFPTAAVLDKNGYFYVIDTDLTRIVKFSSFTKPESDFGGINSSGMTLGFPVALDVFENDYILISDRMRKEIALYDYFGNYVDSFGSELLQEPAGVTVSEYGEVFVCDTKLQNVYLYDLNGNVLGRVSDGKIIQPVSTAVFGDLLYVLDKQSSRIYKFTIIKK